MRQKKIRAKWVVKMPEDAVLRVKKGSRVGGGDVLMEIRQGSVEVIDMSVVLREIKIGEEDSFRSTWLNKEVAEGDVLIKGSGMFPKTIRFPSSGVLRKIDEFFNFEFWHKSEEVKEVKSPVGAKVSEMGSGKMMLEFEAYEYSGEGLVLGKTWADGPIKCIRRISEMDHTMYGKIVAMEDFNQAMFMKAEVLGVKGVIIIGEVLGEIRSGLPVLAINMEEWGKLDIVNKENSSLKILMNSKLGRLLVVVE